MPERLKRFLAWIYQVSPELLMPVIMALVVQVLVRTYCMQHDSPELTLDETNCRYFDTEALQTACFNAYMNDGYTASCRQVPSFETLAPICESMHDNDTIAACVDGLLSGVSDNQGGQCGHDSLATAHAEHVALSTAVAWFSTMVFFAMGSCIYAKSTGHFLGKWNLTDLKDRRTHTRLARCSVWLRRHPVVANMSLKTAAYLPVLVLLPAILHVFQRHDATATTDIESVIRTLNPKQTVCVFQPDHNDTMVNQCHQDFLAGAVHIFVRYHNEGNRTFPPITNADGTYGYLYGANFAVGYLSHAEGMTHDQKIIPALTALAWLLLSMAVCSIKYILDNHTPLQEHANQYATIQGSSYSMWERSTLRKRPKTNTHVVENIAMQLLEPTEVGSNHPVYVSTA